MNGLMLSLVFAKGIMLVQKYPKSLNKENNCGSVCLFFLFQFWPGMIQTGQPGSSQE